LKIAFNGEMAMKYAIRVEVEENIARIRLGSQ
jgi:hypothetical protein